MRWSSSRWLGAASCLFACVACGGSVDRRQHDSSGGGESGAASIDDLGCPDVAWDANCPERLVVELDFAGGARMSSGVWAEPLQLPSFQGLRPGPDLPAPKQPSEWDRSEVPAGACVFRLHGAQLSCLSSTASLLSGPCANPERVRLASFYETARCEQSIAPGCDSDHPFVVGEPWYWYFRPSADGEINVVACAGLCNALLGSKACLFAD